MEFKRCSKLYYDSTGRRWVCALLLGPSDTVPTGAKEETVQVVDKALGPEPFDYPMLVCQQHVMGVVLNPSNVNCDKKVFG